MILTIGELMKIILTLGCLLALTINPSFAKDDDWIKETQNNVRIKQAGIDFLQRNSDTACEKEKVAVYRDTCVRSHDFCRTRREVEKAILENWLKRALRPVPAEMALFHEIDALTTLRCDKVVKDFQHLTSETPAQAPEVRPQPAPEVRPQPAPPSLVTPTPPNLQPAPPSLASPASMKLPPNGPLRAKKGRDAVAPFNVITPDGDHHYVIKLVNVRTGKEEMAFFIKAGSHYKGKVPFGEYRIYGVHGTAWYDWKDYFGDESTFFRMQEKDQNEIVTFYKDKTTAHGKTLTLKGVVDGNAVRVSIDRAEFENN
jgi:hypothetical protein